MRKLVVFTLLVLAGCGDSESPCEAFGARVCTKACECTDGAKCTVQAGAITQTFDTEDDCRGFYVGLACQNATEIDYDGCGDLVDAEACVATPEGTQAVMFPLDPVCHEPTS